MFQNRQNAIYCFYQALLRRLETAYPELQEQGAGMLKVLHAFSDKPPLIRALLEKDLLAGVVLKKSSHEKQSAIAIEISALLKNRDLQVDRSLTTYGSAIPMISEKFGKRPIILGDHGGYFSKSLPEIYEQFDGQLIGVTEHTLNGDVRHLRNSYYDIPYLSTAKADLKERSDSEIAAAIAQEIISHAHSVGKDLLSPNCQEKILLIGYGVMGLHAAKKLIASGSEAEIIVSDINDERNAFALQDGFSIIQDIKNFIPHADIIVLATNVIRGLSPVLNSHDFSLMKSEVLLTSMTSMDDEVDFTSLLQSGVLQKVSDVEQTGIYSGPNGQYLQFMLDGKPANTALADGGSSVNICMVEAAGLAGGFYLAHCHAHGIRPSATLPYEAVEIISQEWITAFTEPEPNFKARTLKPF